MFKWSVFLMVLIKLPGTLGIVKLFRGYFDCPHFHMHVEHLAGPAHDKASHLKVTFTRKIDVRDVDSSSLSNLG